MHNLSASYDKKARVEDTDMTKQKKQLSRKINKDERVDERVWTAPLRFKRN